MKKAINFIPNDDDNLHCLQSCYAMINNAIFNEKLTAIDAERNTNFRKDFPTWQFKALQSFAEKGLKVKDIENFPIELFLNDPVAAVKQQYNDQKVIDYIISASDFDTEVQTVKSALATGNVEFVTRIPTLKDIEFYLKDDWYIFCNVNYWMLEGDSDKYVGHFVIIQEIFDDHLVLQNPGLPPIENQKVSLTNFEKAWNYPDANAANLIVVKR